MNTYLHTPTSFHRGLHLVITIITLNIFAPNLLISAEPEVKCVWGIHEELNPRFRRTQEDAYFPEALSGHEPQLTVGPKNLPIYFFGVYDGHGGHETADFVVGKSPEHSLHKSITGHPDFLTNTPKSIYDGFLNLDAAAGTADLDFNGATITIGFIKGRELWVANAGDGRSVLGKRDGSTERLSFDHKPTVPAEIARIRTAGGFVARGRVNGIISVSRSIGDHAMKQFIIPNPYIIGQQKPGETEPFPPEDITQNPPHPIVLSPEHEFMIIACDGLWDVFSDKEAVTYVQACYKNKELKLYKDFEETLKVTPPSGPTVNPDGLNATNMTPEIAQNIAKALVYEALKKGSMDNITVIVVFFQHQQTPASPAEPKAQPQTTLTRTAQPVDPPQPPVLSIGHASESPTAQPLTILANVLRQTSEAGKKLVNALCHLRTH